MTCESTSSLSSRAIASWEANAAYWDSTITKHGNKYWRRLQEPSLTRLLKLALSSSSPEAGPLFLVTMPCFGPSDWQRPMRALAGAQRGDLRAGHGRERKYASAGAGTLRGRGGVGAGKEGVLQLDGYK
ncbi:hypothetical protein L209DRAFT_755720 [Thermothelomyces heterothallicus CBS 203.75]